MIIQKVWNGKMWSIIWRTLKSLLIHSYCECVEDPSWYITPKNHQFESEWIIINFILLKSALGKISSVIFEHGELISIISVGFSLSIILMPRFHQVEHYCCIVTQMEPHKFPSSTHSFHFFSHHGNSFVLMRFTPCFIDEENKCTTKDWIWIRKTYRK